MTPSEVIKYVQNPQMLSEKNIIDITLLAEKYPYFQTVQLLRIKNLYNIDPSKVKSALNFTASYVTDRKILYYLLHPIRENLEISDDMPDIEMDTKVALPEKEIKDTIQENISDTLENQITYRDTHNDKEIEFSTSINIKKEYGEGIELDDYVVLINKDETDFVEFIKEDDDTQVTNEPLIEKSNTKVKPVKQTKEEIDILTLINKGVSHDEIELGESKFTDEQKKRNSLIDNFIKSNPKIDQKTDKEDINKDVSQKSVQENDHLITDTLANIYLKQGNYAKAIFAYEKLSLKYPEKSAYFAGQIAEIKKIIDKTK